MTTVPRSLAAAVVALMATGTATTAQAATPASAPAQAPTATASTNEIHVADGGSDRSAGSASAPKASIQAAIDAAKPGTVIKVHKGTYSGVLTIRKSGTASAPITLTNAGDGEVVITSSQAPDSCSNTQPSPRRTIKMNGASNWIFRGLTIVHGAYISGEKSNAAYSWHAGKVRARDWQSRRKVPGRGTNDPSSTARVVPYLRSITGASTMQSADRISFIGNTIRGRGVYAALSSYGTFKDNKVSDLVCGSGPGLWVMTFSDHWSVTGNDISRIAPARSHFMYEGIRFGTASNYNYVARNYVHDIASDGRAFNTDVDSSYNLFEHNRASNVSVGFNEQMAGWGNTWQYNQASNFRQYGFGMRLKDASLSKPSMDTSSRGTIMRCNTVSAPIGKAWSLGIGGTMGARISGNRFTTVWVSKPARNYWGAYDNMYNGSKTAPGPNVTPASC